MKYCLILLHGLLVITNGNAQPKSPDELFGELFHDVQMARIFPDGKTFADAIPRQDPKDILAEYRKAKRNKDVPVNLKVFVRNHFTVPGAVQDKYRTPEGQKLSEHIEDLWTVLKRESDPNTPGSSLLPLPNPYIVPGGRFREIYYWDSYFTMLGLKESRQSALVESMVSNFAFLLEQYGRIPNGNRSYYVSRSQPPFFSLMVKLLVDMQGDDVYTSYLKALEREHAYWMAGAPGTPEARQARLSAGKAYLRVVQMEDGSILNRYWDEKETPRPESYREDVETAGKVSREAPLTYRELRSGAMSGWDFSSRWFADGKNLESIQTTSMIPVDLNCLLLHLEEQLSMAYQKIRIDDPSKQAQFAEKAAALRIQAEKRKAAIEKYCWNEKTGSYADYNWMKRQPSDAIHLGAMFPLFFKVASPQRANQQRTVVLNQLLKPGGFVTTTVNSGQQWDAPNGWAPLQWVSIVGLENYGFADDAADAARRWVELNKAVYQRTGRLMEKYNVENTSLEAGGGEYPSQDGFGWTNGVLVALGKRYSLSLD